MALTLTNAEIIEASPLLLADVVSKATDGSTTTLITHDLRDLDEYSVIGAYICFLDGENKGIDRIITDYSSAGGVATFTFDTLDFPIDNTTIFAIMYLSYKSASDRANAVLTNDLKKKGFDINFFLNPADLKELHLYRTVAHICLAKTQDRNDEDTYWVNYETYMEMYNTELNTLVADYDSDESGSISTEEEDLNIGQVGFQR